MKSFSDSFDRFLEDYISRCVKAEVAKQLSARQSDAPTSQDYVPQPKAKASFVSQQKRVRDAILSATQFKGLNGFARTDVVSLMQSIWDKESLTTAEKQIITNALLSLVKEEKIASNGKKTKAARYYFQREDREPKLLPTGGFASYLVQDSGEQATVQEGCQGSIQEGGDIQSLPESS